MHASPSCLPHSILISREICIVSAVPLSSHHLTIFWQYFVLPSTNLSFTIARDIPYDIVRHYRLILHSTVMPRSATPANACVGDTISILDKSSRRPRSPWVSSFHYATTLSRTLGMNRRCREARAPATCPPSRYTSALPTSGDSSAFGAFRRVTFIR
ncbi:hypothetical protein AB1N83_010186 [Pleurotus pulmonarius]